MKALEHDPELRYQSPDQLGDDLGRFLENEAIEAGPHTRTYQIQKFVRRHRAAVGGAAAAAITLLAGALLALAGWLKAESAYESLRLTNKSEQAARRDTQRQLVERLIDKGTQQLNQGECIGLVALQEAVEAATGLPELERKALKLWNLGRTCLPGKIHTIVDSPYAVALSHNESLLCWLDAHGLHIKESHSGQGQSFQIEDRLFDAPWPWVTLDLVFSEDNRMVALHNPFSGVAQVYDAGTLQPLTKTLLHPETGFAIPARPGRGWNKVAFSPNGKFLATIAFNRSACLWNVDRSELATPSWTVGVNPTKLGFSPSGKSLILSSLGRIQHVNLLDSQFSSQEFTNSNERRAVYEMLVQSDSKLITGNWNSASIGNLEKQKVVAHYQFPGIEMPNNLIEYVGLSPDGRTAAFGTHDNGRMFLLDAKTLEPRDMPSSPGGGGVRGGAFSANGSVLAAACIDGSVRYWNPIEPRRYLGAWPQPPRVDRVFTGNLGRLLLTAGSKSAVLRTFPRETSVKVGLIPNGGDLMDITFDGGILLVRSHDRRRLSIWSRSGRKLGSGPAIDPTAGQIMNARFSPDTQEIVYNTSAPGKGESYRNWSISEASHGDFHCEMPNEKGITETALGAILPTSPRSIVVGSLAWQFKVVDLSSSEVVSHTYLTNQSACVAVNTVAGWYGVGDKSGVFTRFHIENHEEIFPRFELNERLLFAACSGDGEWLLTVETNSKGSRTLRAWLVGGESPFYHLKMPFPHDSGRVFPVGERGFVFQVGQELRRFDLPAVNAAADEVSSLTEALLGVKKNERDQSRFRMLTEDEFSGVSDLNRTQ